MRCLIVFHIQIRNNSVLDSVMGSRGKLKSIKIQGGTKLFPSLERPYPGPRSRLDSSVFLRPSCTRSLADNTSYVCAQWDGEILSGGEIDLNFVSRDFCNCWEHSPSMVRWVLLNYRYGGDTGGDARKGVQIRQPRGSAGWKVSWISFHRANNLHQTPVSTWILFHPSWASLPIQHLTQGGNTDKFFIAIPVSTDCQTLIKTSNPL